MWFQAVQQWVRQNNWGSQEYQKCLVTLHRGIECPESEKNQGSRKIKPIHRKHQSILRKQAAEFITVASFAVKEKTVSFTSWFIWAVLAHVWTVPSPNRPDLHWFQEVWRGLTQMEEDIAQVFIFEWIWQVFTGQVFIFEWIFLPPAVPAFLCWTFCTEAPRVSAPAFAGPS